MSPADDDLGVFAFLLRIADQTPPASPAAPTLERRQLTEGQALIDLGRQLVELPPDASPIERAKIAARVHRAYLAAFQFSDDEVTERRRVVLRALETGLSIRQMLLSWEHLSPAHKEHQTIDAARVVLDQARMVGIHNDLIGAAIEAWGSPHKPGRWEPIHQLALACGAGASNPESFRTAFLRLP